MADIDFQPIVKWTGTKRLQSNEIIKYFPEEEYAKIPKEKIEFYKNNMDKDYVRLKELEIAGRVWLDTNKDGLTPFEITISPVVVSNSPLNNFKNVDFPLPFAPIKP